MPLLAQPQPESFWIGTVIALAGMLVRLYASGFIVKNQQLATDGPYSIVRHPLYTGNLLLLIGFTFASGQWWALLVSAAFWWFYYPTAIEYEDRQAASYFWRALAGLEPDRSRCHPPRTRRPLGLELVLCNQSAPELRTDHRRLHLVLAVLHRAPAWLIPASAVETLLSSGYQGTVYLVEEDGLRYVVKRPGGSALTGWFRRAMLRREYAAYLRLAGVDRHSALHRSWPRGRVAPGTLSRAGHCVTRVTTWPTKWRSSTDCSDWSRHIHAAGVAHADLKRKDNILVDEQEQPWLIDFGSAVLARRVKGAVGCFARLAART